MSYLVGYQHSQACKRTRSHRLRQIFICCHPTLPREGQVALTLREICGLSTEEIARAFLITQATLAPRIVRAKAQIRETPIPYEVPSPQELLERLDAVLQVIYLVFNEGYSAPAGAEVTRAELTGGAIRLGRLLKDLQPEPEGANPEIMGLLALMLLQESRRAARTSPTGELILVDNQDRALWNREQIADGVALVRKPGTPAASVLTRFKSLQILAKDKTFDGFIRTMADFGDSLLGSTGRSSKRQSLTSARDLVLLFAGRTGGSFNGVDPAAYESGVLDSVYLQAIEGAAAYSSNPAFTGDLVRSFLEFDLYLVARHGKGPIDKEEMPWPAHDLDEVYASLITFEQYAETIAVIDHTWPVNEAKERRSIARLLVILGFRFGLRRREALCLRMRDLYLHGVCEILMRPSNAHRLKSPDAKHRLPLDALCQKMK